MNKLKIGKRTAANILAALRFWQEEMLDNGGVFAARERYKDHFEGVEPYTSREIDQLCERVNTAEDTFGTFVKKIASLKLNYEMDEAGVEGRNSCLNHLILEARQILTNS